MPVVVCINKIDLPVVVNNEKRFMRHKCFFAIYLMIFARIKDIEQEAKQFIALEKAVFVPVSAKSKSIHYAVNIV